MSPGTGGRWVGPAPTGGRRVPQTRRTGGASPYRSAEAGHDTAEVPGVAIGPLVGAEAVLMLTNEPVPEAPLKGAVSLCRVLLKRLTGWGEPQVEPGLRALAALETYSGRDEQGQHQDRRG